MQRDQAIDMRRRRAGGVPPKMLEDMTFVGTIDVNVTVDSMSE